jgi:malate dehydrogenase
MAVKSRMDGAEPAVAFTTELNENLMSKVDPIRIAVSGAAGRVGYSLVFRIAAGALFGREQPVDLRLLELPDAGRRLEALEMELRDCAFPSLGDLRVGVDPREMFEDADWIILLGGKPIRSELANRADLLRENTPIMVDHGRAINHVAPNARILVVTHPCNTNCLIAKSQAHNVPAEHWFALNQLARTRALALISEKTGLAVSQISRVIVWGNNSESIHIDLRHARANGRAVLQAINDANWQAKVLEPAIAARGREILDVRGSTPAGSVAQAILGTIRAITTPTPFERWFAASVISDGSYGVPRGLVFGFPLLTPDGKTWSIVDDLYVDQHTRDRIAANVAELEGEAAAVSHLLGNVVA